MQESTLKQAFVGIRTDESQMWRLLLQCGAESVSEFASQESKICKTSFNFKPDEREPMSKEEYQALISIFCNFYTEIPNDFILSSGLPDNLLEYFFERAVASNKRVPSQFLYHFAKGIRKLNVSTRLVSILCGRPGNWLHKNAAKGTSRNFTPTVLPHEVFDATPDAAVLLNVWNDFTGKERVLIFEQTHRWNPTLAFEILRLGRTRLTHDSLDSCLASIFDSLSEKDLEYLEGKDKKTDWTQSLNNNWRWSSSCNQIVCDLLARLPSSEYARQAFETTKKFLTNSAATNDLTHEGGGRIRNSAPLDAFLTLGSVPLSRWEEILSASPTEIRALLQKRKSFQRFSLAQLRSFSIFGASDEWFEVCCDSFLDLCQVPQNDQNKQTWRSFAPFEWTRNNWENPFVKKALATGRADHFARLLSLWNEKIETFGKYDNFAFNLLKSAFRFCPYPWDDELARMFCDVLVRSISSNESVSKDAAKLLLPTLCFCPRSVREERRELATSGTGDFKPSKDEAADYFNACAWRDRFDKLFGTPKKG